MHLDQFFRSHHMGIAPLTPLASMSSTTSGRKSGAGLFIVIGANPIVLYLLNIMWGSQFRRVPNTYTTWLALKLETWRGWTPEMVDPAGRFANAWR